MKTLLGFMASLASLREALAGRVRMKTLLVWALVLGAIAGVGLGFAWRKDPTPPPNMNQANEWVAANGKTEGLRRELLLRPDITGKIGKVLVKTNDSVKAGALLVELDNGIQHAQVKVAEAQLKGREADRKTAQDIYDRFVKSGIAANAAETARASAGLQRANADMDMAKAELKRAQAELEKTELRAPWDGCVLEVFEEPGALVGPSSQPILRLNDVSKRRVRAYVEELDALRVRPGQTAVVTADGLPGQEFPGRISAEVYLRMDRDAPRSDAPGEYQDIYHRPVVIDLEGGLELPLNLRVQVRIHAGQPPERR